MHSLVLLVVVALALVACSPEPQVVDHSLPTLPSTPEPTPVATPKPTPRPAPVPAPTPTPVVAAPREKIIAEGIKLLGVREATGKNDGPMVDAILASVGLRGSGAPWCAAANRYIYDQAGLHDVGPRSAWSPDWVAKPTWTKAKGGRTPMPGDAWGIWFSSKGRVAHTGLVEKWGSTVTTLEGNTSPDAVAGSASDRDGEGFHRKRRLQSQIYSVRDWLE